MKLWNVVMGCIDYALANANVNAIAGMNMRTWMYEY